MPPPTLNSEEPLSGSSLPIRIFITYPELHNLSVSALEESAAGPRQNSQRAPVVGSMGAEGGGAARNSSYRLVSMATRQPVVPQILKE